MSLMSNLNNQPKNLHGVISPRAGGGRVKDVMYNNVSVVNEEGIAEIPPYPNVPVKGVMYGNESAVDSQGIARIPIPSIPDIPTISFKHVVGYIFSLGNGNNNAWGWCDVLIIGDYARLDFSAQITGSGSGDDFSWGLDIDKIRAIDPTIPNIKSTLGGLWDVYGGYDNSKMQWSPVLNSSSNNKKWTPARYYQQDPLMVGSWSASTWGNGSHIRGFAFGEVINLEV